MNQATEATAMQATQNARRTVSRIDKKMHLGPDSQVDDRVVYIAPTEPLRTDPFLLLSEDWFSTTGFEWHPHAVSRRSRWSSMACSSTATTSATPVR